MVAAQALADNSPVLKNREGNLLPPLDQIRNLSLQVAHAVAKEAIQSGLAPHMTDEQAKRCIENEVWTPEYVPYQPA